MPRSRQLAAIMFTDIEGYTALMQQSEKMAVRIRDRHRSVFGPITQKHDGRIIQYYGDGTLSIFNSAVEAVKCAVELQSQFRQEPVVPLRIGIHIGDIILDKDDIIGDSVNLASRIESLAVAGSILISAKVLEEIKNQDSFPVRHMGSFHFKNDGKARDVYAIDHPEIVVPKGAELKGKTVPDSGKKSSKGLWRSARLRWTLSAFLLIAILIVAGVRWLQWQTKIEWARQTAFPEIEQLADKSDYGAAFSLAREAEKYLPDDPKLSQIWPRISRILFLKTEPEGADVYQKPYDSIQSQWVYLGKTPIDSLPVPFGFYRWKIEKEGYHTLEYASGTARNAMEKIVLDKRDSVPEGMERALSLDLPLFIPGLDHLEKEPLKPYFIDRFEVSNKAYKIFVDAAGYKNEAYWKFPFLKDGKELSFEEAMAEFKDKTGRQGPATWEAGNFPNGEEDFPVQGVSWYEAAAFATFAGKSLPTIFHWNNAATTRFGYQIIPKSNFSQKGPAPVGSYQGLGYFGTYDLAGNVREWCLNASNSIGQHYILGGGWNDATYAYIDAYTQDGFNRAITNGFRCIQLIEPNVNQPSLERPVGRPFRDFYAETPVDDASFEIFLRLFAYDKQTLNATVEKINFDNDNWTIEKIEFNAAYGGERMVSYLFLPVNKRPPYAPVVYFPGSNVIHNPILDPVRGRHVNSFDFLMKSGRAVLFPVIKGTFERGDELDSDYPDETNFYKEHVIMWAKDISRSIDYLETREDIELDKLSYFGVSWGGAMGGIIPAVEKRIKSVVLYVAGLNFQRSQPEADAFNYLPRITVPVLMLNGEHDFFFPVETSQKPMFDYLGTPPEHKRYIVHQSGHFVPRDRLIQETLDWLDLYQGKVPGHLN